MRDLGVEFEVVKSDAKEVAYPADPERTVLENALRKGDLRNSSLFTLTSSLSPILSADTIVWFDNKIYGKPKDLEEAKEFLRTLSGKTHVVFTGVALRCLTDQNLASRSAYNGGGESSGGSLASRSAYNGGGESSGGSLASRSAYNEAEQLLYCERPASTLTAVVKSEVKFRELSEAMIDEYVVRVKPTDRAGAYDIDESGDLIVESYSGSYENIMGLPVEPLRDWGVV